MSPRLYIVAMDDLPYYTYYILWWVCNRCTFCLKMSKQCHFPPKRLYRIYATTSQYLSSYNILYIYLCDHWCICMYMSSSIPIYSADSYFLTLQVKRLLEHVNCQVPNLSRNLFIIFNHWDQVADEESDSDDDDDDSKENPERVKEQHLEGVRRFVEQGLKAKAVVDRTFFLSGKETCKAQKDEEKGKQSTAGRSVVYMQSPYLFIVTGSPRPTALNQHHDHFCMLNIVLPKCNYTFVI